jgi:toxin FitB
VNYLIDTNVISELVSARPSERVLEWLESVSPQRIYLSVITIGEIQKGIDKLEDSVRRERLAAWLHQDLLQRFANQMVSIDAETMLVWGSLNARLERLGRPISAIDGLLAACALQGQFTLVTRNSAHFADTGVPLLNPWQSGQL